MDRQTPQQRHEKATDEPGPDEARISTDEQERARRSANMAAIHAKDTKPEIIVRRWLWANGYRYRLNHPRLPGKPDIVMRKYRTCIFVNGCFWHGHHINLQFKNSQFKDSQFKDLPLNDLPLSDLQLGDLPFAIESSECCKIPKTNREFWVTKILRNRERDARVQRQLAAMGWHCITIWECELRPKLRAATLDSLAYTLNKIFLLNLSTQAQGDDLQDRSITPYDLPAEDPLMAAEDSPAAYGEKPT